MDQKGGLICVQCVRWLGCVRLTHWDPPRGVGESVVRRGEREGGEWRVSGREDEKVEE